MTLRDTLQQLGESAEEARWAPLRRLAAVTALTRLEADRFERANWWRGPLLYTLVQRLRPRHILEVGAGHGYGALCMAQASVDGGWTATVWTIDRLAPTTPQRCVVDEENGPRCLRMSVAELWAQYVPAALSQRVRWLTGDSRSVMTAWRTDGRPAVEFCFLDASHDYWSVKHDFVAALGVAAAGCTFLFDDYTARPRFGVRRLIDHEVAPRLPAGTVEILNCGVQIPVGHRRSTEHQMAWVQGDAIGHEPLAQFYSDQQVQHLKWQYAALQLQRRTLTQIKQWLRVDARAS